MNTNVFITIDGRLQQITVNGTKVADLRNQPNFSSGTIHIKNTDGRRVPVSDSEELKFNAEYSIVKTQSTGANL